MFCIDLANLQHGSLVSGWKTPYTLPLRSRVDSESTFFANRWHHRPTHRPLAFDLFTLQCLITTTTTMADYILVFMLQKISSQLGLLTQNIMLLCHYTEHKRIVDNRQASFVWFLLLLTVCIQCASFMHMLLLLFSVFGEFQAPPIGLEDELQCVESFSMDPFGRKYSWNHPKKD